MTITDSLLVLVVALQLADAATTLYALDLGAMESNPVLARLFPNFGVVNTLVATKGAFIVVLMLMHFYGQNSHWLGLNWALPEWMYWAMAGGFAVLVGWNLSQIRKQRQINESR